MGLKTYLLIRVGLDVGREEWFGKKMGVTSGAPEAGSPAKRAHPVGRKPITEASLPEKGAPSVEGSYLVDAGGVEGRTGAAGRGRSRDGAGSGGRGMLHPLRALRQRRKDRQKAKWQQKLQAAMEQERERQLAIRARTLGEVEAAIGRLAKEIEEYADGQEDCHYVYEDSLRRALLSGEDSPSRNRETCADGEAPVLPLLWQKHFQGKAFRGYAQQFWVEQLLPQAAQPHFVILGTAPCLFHVIEKCADRMKSLRWILPETDCDEDLLGFVEDFCTEYGLAIMLEPLQSAAELKRLRLVCPEPVNVLDFTGEAYMAVSDLPKGSVWLDMLSVEEKQRRVIARGTGITYVSLKEKWKTVQRRCTCPILP